MPRPDQEFKGKLWTNRGIAAEVARERGYLCYEKHDISMVKDHFALTGYVKVKKTHDHDVQYKPPKTPHKPGKYSNYLSPEERRARHAAKHHGGLDVAGEHKHMWKIKNPDEDHARRLDIHPWASERLTVVCC